MALNDLERRRAEKAVGAFIAARRPPPHFRPQLDLGFRVSGQSVELFEIRPRWNRPEVKRESPFAKATLVRSRGPRRPARARGERGGPGVSDDLRSCPHCGVAPVTGRPAEVATPRSTGYFC